MSGSTTTGQPRNPTRRLTVRQAAEEWQLHPGTVRKAIRKGKLPAIWAGTGYRLLADDVEAWIRSEWGERR